MNITGLLSLKTVSKFALWFMEKQQGATCGDAHKALDRHFEELHNARITNDKLFYVNFPHELEQFANNEELYEKLIAMYNEAYQQGYTDGVKDLDNVINRI